MGLEKSKCKRCGINYIQKRKSQKYCSKRCNTISAKKAFMLRLRGEPKWTNRPSILKFCPICSKEFRVYAHEFVQTCSKKCGYELMKQRITKTASTYRRNALLVYNKKCYDCGYEEHPEIIMIHHIDGDRTNGAIDNLIPLCPNCHAIRHEQQKRKLA